MREKHSWDVFLQQWHSTLEGNRLQSPLMFTSAKLCAVVFMTQVHAGLGGALGPSNPDNFQSRWSTVHLLCTPLTPPCYKKMVFSTEVSACSSHGNGSRGDGGHH